MQVGQWLVNVTVATSNPVPASGFLSESSVASNALHGVAIT